MGLSSRADDKLLRQVKEREKQKDSLKHSKDAILQQHSRGMRDFDHARTEKAEEEFRNQTVGLITKEEFVEKQRQTFQVSGEEDAANDAGKRRQEGGGEGKTTKKSKKVCLSFAMDEEEEEEEEEENVERGDGKTMLATFGKDPSIATDFLPDKDRELEEERMRNELKNEWIQRQAEIKKEPLEITYSYYNGSGHRKSVTVCKGDTVSTFLKAVQQQLAPDFREIKSSSSSSLMYIKEDVILPHTMTFYELISKKAQGKSGPLFQFDVQEYTVTQSDPRMKSKDRHAGKVVERQFYSKNKHIFPFSAWEPYDPEKHEQP
ncbi:hypothetical protein M9434_003926 [Picochlorum sp. BPE23]|nr:hypothetical protein M9434_003926 [Picochlorum sp. BPE23]